MSLPNPEAKDITRIESMIKKSAGNTNKILQYASNMAKAIAGVSKAQRRASACIEVANSGNVSQEIKSALVQAHDIFLLRAQDLGGPKAQSYFSPGYKSTYVATPEPPKKTAPSKPDTYKSRRSVRTLESIIVEGILKHLK